ncbi:MAG TPA: hypothetical protein VNT25_00145 [Allosphingosinicella sp.]|nr:hypothetical protein [Allosphingosinicella sp.]
MPHRLLAVALSPLSFLAARPQSAIEVVHNLSFTALGGSRQEGEVRLSLSGDRRRLKVSARSGGIDPAAIQLWRLSGSAWPGAGAFLVVLVETGRSRTGSPFDLTFDLDQSATFSGSVDAAYLSARGLPVADAAAGVGNMLTAPAVPAAPQRAQERPRPAPRRLRRTRRRKQVTGAFTSRDDLTARVWALRRQQVFPNIAAIARECDTTPDVVKTIIQQGEGLDSYLEKGCLLG